MTMLHVIVQPLEKETPAEPDVKNYQGELNIVTMVILEAGSVNPDTGVHDTSVSFRLVDEKGNSYMAQLTGNIFRTAFGAFRGADERFKGL